MINISKNRNHKYFHLNPDNNIITISSKFIITKNVQYLWEYITKWKKHNRKYKLKNWWKMYHHGSSTYVLILRKFKIHVILFKDKLFKKWMRSKKKSKKITRIVLLLWLWRGKGSNKLKSLLKRIWKNANKNKYNLWINCAEVVKIKFLTFTPVFRRKESIEGKDKKNLNAWLRIFWASWQKLLKEKKNKEKLHMTVFWN